MPKEENKKPTEEVLSRLQPIADALKVGVGEIWKIFVKRWLAMGISQLIVALAVSGVSIWKLNETNWVFLPLGVSLLIIYNAINLIINPEYFAVTDITKRLKDDSRKLPARYY